jgi:hypothetical protein
MILPQGVPSQRGSVSAFAERLVADNPPRLYLPEDASRPNAGTLVYQVGYRSEAERIAALVRHRDLGQAVDASTDHALLVVLGEYARQLGLIERLQAVPIDQRQGDYTPQSKLIEFLVGILAGLEHLEDLNQAAAPLVKDQAVITSWGQAGFAHYSGVSRTLSAAGDDTLSEVIEVLQTISQPFIDAEVMALARRGQALVLDTDLTGRKVSSTSTTYPDAGCKHRWTLSMLANAACLTPCRQRARKKHCSRPRWSSGPPSFKPTAGSNAHTASWLRLASGWSVLKNARPVLGETCVRRPRG